MVKLEPTPDTSLTPGLDLWAPQLSQEKGDEGVLCFLSSFPCYLEGEAVV